MVKFETKIYNAYDSGEKVIGAEVIVYDEEGDVIKSIIVTDETAIDELIARLDEVDNTYVRNDAIGEILANSGLETTINATKLGGVGYDQYVLSSTLASQTFTPKPHASNNVSTYGGATSSNYGHVKVRDNLTASSTVASEALSSHQGYVLNSKITAIEDKIDKNDVRILIGRKDDGAGEQGTQIIVQYGTNGIYGKLDCPDPNYDKSGKTIRFLINDRIYDRPTGADGKTQPVNFTTLPRGSYLITALMAGADGKNPVSEQKFLIVQ